MQVGLHGIARFERDIACVEHGLHVGEVGAQHGAGLAVDRDVDVRGLAVQCLTGIATGGGVGIGDGIRGRLRCRLRLRVGIDAARGQAAGHNQANTCGRCGNTHPLTLAQRSKGGVVRLVMGRHYAPLTTFTNPRAWPSRRSQPGQYLRPLRQYASIDACSAIEGWGCSTCDGPTLCSSDYVH